jgi:hypothetical protein
MDLIMKLLLSKELLIGTQYNSILVIVDKLTKYAYFIPYKELHMAEELAYTFNRIVAEQHGLLE